MKMFLTALMALGLVAPAAFAEDHAAGHAADAAPAAHADAAKPADAKPADAKAKGKKKKVEAPANGCDAHKK